MTKYELEFYDRLYFMNLHSQYGGKFFGWGFTHVDVSLIATLKYRRYKLPYSYYSNLFLLLFILKGKDNQVQVHTLVSFFILFQKGKITDSKDTCSYKSLCVFKILLTKYSFRMMKLKLTKKLLYFQLMMVYTHTHIYIEEIILVKFVFSSTSNNV